MLAWSLAIILSFLTFVFFPNLHLNPIFIVVVYFITLWAWKDMITIWVCNHMLRRNQMNEARVLVLTGINVIELVFIFGIWYLFAGQYFTEGRRLPAFNNPWNALRFSADSLFESGSAIQVSTSGLIPYYVERFTGILLIVIIIALIMSYFGNAKKT